MSNDGLSQIGIGNEHLFFAAKSGNELALGATPGDMTAHGDFQLCELDINDDTQVHFQLPYMQHRNPLQGIVCWMYWAIDEAYATANGEVRFQYDWSMVANDGTEDIGAPGTTGTGNTGDININATADTIASTTLFTIPIASIAYGDALSVQITRIALDAGVDPTADPGIMSIRIRGSQFFPSYNK